MASFLGWGFILIRRFMLIRFMVWYLWLFVTSIFWWVLLFRFTTGYMIRWRLVTCGTALIFLVYFWCTTWTVCSDTVTVFIGLDSIARLLSGVISSIIRLAKGLVLLTIYLIIIFTLINLRRFIVNGLFRCNWFFICIIFWRCDITVGIILIATRSDFML